jgi:hypothetical protein
MSNLDYTTASNHVTTSLYSIITAPGGVTYISDTTVEKTTSGSSDFHTLIVMDRKTIGSTGDYSVKIYASSSGGSSTKKHAHLLAFGNMF